MYHTAQFALHLGLTWHEPDSFLVLGEICKQEHDVRIMYILSS